MHRFGYGLDTETANASAGNRTRVTSMATMYSTTRPLMLWLRCLPEHNQGHAPSFMLNAYGRCYRNYLCYTNCLCYLNCLCYCKCICHCDCTCYRLRWPCCPSPMPVPSPLHASMPLHSCLYCFIVVCVCVCRCQAHMSGTAVPNPHGRKHAHTRHRGDSNPCGQSPMDFKSIILTTRTQCH